MNAIIECRAGGVRLFHDSASAADPADVERLIAQEIEWVACTLEAAAPWPALQALLEPLGELKAGEGNLTIGTRARTVAHAWSLICLAVRLHRIQVWLEGMTSAPARKKTGRSKPPMTKHIAYAQKIYDNDVGATKTSAAEQAVAEYGWRGGRASKEAAIYHIRTSIKDRP